MAFKNSGKKKETLTIPSVYQGKAVVVIGDNAFAGSDVLQRVIIPKNAMIKSFTADSLSNCATLRFIEIHLEPSALPANPEAVAKMPNSNVINAVSRAMEISFFMIFSYKVDYDTRPIPASQHIFSQIQKILSVFYKFFPVFERQVGICHHSLCYVCPNSENLLLLCRHFRLVVGGIG